MTDRSDIIERTSDIASWLTTRECAKNNIEVLDYSDPEMSCYTEDAQAIFNDYYDSIEPLVITKELRKVIHPTILPNEVRRLSNFDGTQRTYYCGTFAKDQASFIRKSLHQEFSEYKHIIRFRGRGHRNGGRHDQSLPLALSSSIAIYIDIKEKK